jgi:hypothetical protein
MPRGSYLALSHPADDIEPDAMAKMADRLNRVLAEPITLRPHDEVAGFFDGLELVDPGMVRASRWRPDNENDASAPATLWAGIAKKL